MAKKFTYQISDISAPETYDRAGQLSKSAATIEGQADAAGTQRKTQLGASLFQEGREAVIGYAQADIEKDTKEALSRFEDSPENVKGMQAVDAVETLENRLGLEAGDTTSIDEDPAINALRKEAQRYKQAVDQGLWTKDQALTHIAASVKKWSARMPGLQSEFRKTAANLTGISNVDIYQINQALTTQSAREKAAVAAQAAELRYIEDVAKYHGKPPSLVTPQDQERYYMFTQAKAAREALENENKTIAANDEQKGRRVDQQIQLVNSQNLLRVSSLMNDWNQANTDPSMHKRRDQLTIQIQAELGQMKTDAIRYAQQQGAQLGVNVKDRVKEVSDLYDNYLNMTKNQQGFDALRLLIGRKEDGVKEIEANITLANPFMRQLQRYDFADDMLMLYMDKGAKHIEQKFGPAAAQAAERAFKNPNQFVPLHTRSFAPEIVEQHGSPDLRGGETAAHTPEEKLTIYNDGLSLLAGASNRTAPTDNQKLGGVNGAKLVLKNFIGTETNRDVIRNTLATLESPRVIAFLDQMPEPVKMEMATTIHNNHTLAAREHYAKAVAAVEKLNSDPSNLNRQAGRVAVVGQAPDGSLSIQWTQTGTPSSPAAGYFGPGGGFAGGAQGGLVSPDSQEAYRDAQRFVEKLNVNLKMLGLGNRLRGEGAEQSAMALGVKVMEAAQSNQPSLPPMSAMQEKQQEEALARRKEATKDRPLADERDFIREEEGSHATVYKDSQGNPTIGVGFNLNRKDSSSVLKNVLGLKDEEVEAVKGGKQELTPAQIDKLYSFNLKEAQDIVKGELDWSKLTPGQRTALTSLAFNGGAGLIGEKLVAAIESGDMAAAEAEIRKNSGSQRMPELQGRRDREADIFKR